MTDSEIMKRLMEADRHLKAYIDLVKPVAEELARQKSIHVFGVDGGYLGQLGCWEEGIDTVCLHIKDDFQEKKEKLEGHYDRVLEFEEKWGSKAKAAGIEHFYISGHF